MKNKQSYIYIMTNKKNGTIYTGVTSNLIRRVHEHKRKIFKGFTQKYELDKLVYYQIFDNIEDAITREKQIKGGSRKKKLDLINEFNKDWEDLYEKIV
ncbi:MAG: GIY-YIG nuclease family protein [Candidatus Gastranaerophilales bacterium]|nr:GIY-YIG nuclease family protein [Candidatus Gastranaerophilales bacterium]